MIKFSAKLRRPADVGEVTWTFVNLPQEASDQLSSRGLVAVEGFIHERPFSAVLQPDGKGGHWLQVEGELMQAIGAKPGDLLSFEVAPASVEPEPKLPEDFAEALASDPKTEATWNDITTLARRDWIHWVTTGKRAETRPKRIAVACSKLSAGSRRPCCFDRSGMYSKSLSCPKALDES